MCKQCIECGFHEKELKKTIKQVTKMIETEVCNRYFWDSLLTCNFQINKKYTRKLLKFLPIPPNISMTPVYTKKIIALKNIHIKPKHFL